MLTLFSQKKKLILLEVIALVPETNWYDTYQDVMNVQLNITSGNVLQ